MKKLCFSSLFMCISVLSFGQIVNIPDANFKNALVNSLCVDSDFDQVLDQDVDTNNDGEIQASEAALVRDLYVSNRSISSLEGIASFTSLRDLYCQNNNLSTLDVSNLYEMFALDCSHNLLVDLKLSSREYIVDCSHNLLTNIDFNTDNTQFDTLTLDISYNQFTNLDFPSSINDLDYLTLSNNPFVSLLIPAITVRTQLTCDNLNNLVYLESHASLPWSWSTLSIRDNPNLENINLQNNFREFGFYNVDSSSVNYWLHGNPISNCPSLQNICVDDFEIPALLQYFGNTNVTVNLECTSLTTNNLSKTIDFKIFPNPTKDILNIDVDGSVTFQSIAIYNPLGQLIKTLTDSEWSSSSSIDVSALKTGTYFMEINSNQGKTTKKFIKL